jgi:hypothetical protein
MQSSKASSQTRDQLKQWLERPGIGAENVLANQGAKEDLKWLDQQKDLSVVHLDGSKEGQEKGREGSVREKGSGANAAGAGGGGFARVFGCAGRRK